MKNIFIIASLIICGCGTQNANGESSIVEIEEPETHLFLIYGQSNGAGSTKDIDTTPALSGELWNVWSKAPAILKDPTRYDGEFRGSAWPVFAEEYNRLSGNTAIILNAAVPGAAMDELKVGTTNHDLAMRWLQDALTHYGSKIKSVSMIFVHGEADAGSYTPYDTYFNGLAEISNHLQLVTDKCTVTYIHRVGLNLYSRPYTQQQFLKFGHEMIERTKLREDWKPVFVKAPTFNFENGLQEPDYVHYSRAGYTLMGREMASNIHYYQRRLDVAPGLYSESAYITEFGVVPPFPPPQPPPSSSPPCIPHATIDPAAINVILQYYLFRK